MADTDNRSGRETRLLGLVIVVALAALLLLGAADGFANIHAPNERVLIDELEKATVAEAEFFGEYARRSLG